MSEWKKVDEIAAHNAEHGRTGLPDAFEPLTTLTLRIEGVAIDGTDVVLVHFGRQARLAQDDVVGWRERTTGDEPRGYDVRIKRGARLLVQWAVIADSHDALAPLFDPSHPSPAPRQAPSQSQSQSQSQQPGTPPAPSHEQRESHGGHESRDTPRAESQDSRESRPSQRDYPGRPREGERRGDGERNSNRGSDRQGGERARNDGPYRR